MPILSSDIKTKVKYYSGAPLDKIVKVWEGTFDKATDTTNRTDGFTGSINIYSFAHGFTRPLFLTYLWSDDAITWVDGGSTNGGNASLAFCDATNVHLIASSGAGTQYYRVIASWIDNYDNTNPLITEYASATKTTKYDSRVNYQKIHSQGESSYSAGVFGSITTVSIPHTLGYIPNAKAWFEPIAGEVWPLNSGGASNPFLYTASQDEAYMEIYDNRVDVVVSRFSNASRRVWHKVYFDG